jgi:tRNA(Ile)-lysidine synthase
VGCSGGPDSLALTWLAHRWAAGRCIALIVDHGLRHSSTAEAAGVAAQLAAHGIAARVLPLALPGGNGLQARARAARRTALLAACRDAGAPHLLLAHHAEDQAETLLFRALRGSGPIGLAGMASLSLAAEAMILRPLLTVPRERLGATCVAAGLRPVQDPSNTDQRFARARLRVAAIGSAGWAVGAAAAFGFRRARMEAALARRAAEALRLWPEGCARLNRDRLGDDAIARAVLGAAVRIVGGRVHGPSPGGVTGLLAAGQGTLGGARWLANGWLVREAPAGPVEARAGALWDGRFCLDTAWPGHVVGPCGPVQAGRLRGRARHLPAAALAALPALRRGGAPDDGAEGDAMLANIPHLTYRDAGSSGRLPVHFSPLGGPLAGLCVRNSPRAG